jgi:hypothetical protein
MAYFAADLNYVYFMRRFPEPRSRTPTRCRTSGAGVAELDLVAGLSIAGILLGDRVPGHWGLGFAGILVLIGLVGSMLNDRATCVAAAVAAVVRWRLRAAAEAEHRGGHRGRGGGRPADRPPQHAPGRRVRGPHMNAGIEWSGR